MTTQNPENSESISKEENEKLPIPPLRPRYSFGREVLLTLNALVVMPMYTMLIGLWIYTAMLYFAPTLWLRSLLLLYIPYIVLWDSSPSNGCRPFGNRSACRSVRCYKWFAQYFDMKLVKTCDLDPKKNYIMLYHPHGIISVGANTALNTNGCDFETVFPGVSTEPET
jgi:2-acylglycerol O-acyltransferase 2